MDHRLQRLAEASALRIGQLVVVAVEGDRSLAGPDRAHDLDVLAGPGERLCERHPVPAFDDLRARDPEAADEAATREVVHRHRRHRRRGRLAGAQLQDRRAEAQALGVRPPPGQRRDRVRSVGLGGPDRVEAEALSLLHLLQRPGGRPRGPVADLQAQLQILAHRPRSLVLRPWRSGRAPRSPKSAADTPAANLRNGG